MRRLNYGNISVINPSASNRTAVAGQPWMNTFWVNQNQESSEKRNNFGRNVKRESKI